MTSPTQRRHDEILGRLDALIDAMTPGDKQPAPDVDPDEGEVVRTLWRNAADRWRRRAESAAADVERLTRERDKWKRNYETSTGHIVQLTRAETEKVRAWLAMPNGACSPSHRCTLEAVQGGGILVRTRRHSREMGRDA